MSDAKISELPSATTPLAGTELVPIVQGGETRRVAVSEIGGGASVAEVTINLGTVPRWSTRVSFTATAEAGSRVVMVASGADGDEAEMDGLTCAARVTATDTIEAFITAHPGPVAGVRRFNLLLG